MFPTGDKRCTPETRDASVIPKVVGRLKVEDGQVKNNSFSTGVDGIELRRGEKEH